MDFSGKIVEVIREGEIVRMPENQAIEEDLFILRKLIESEKMPFVDTNVRNKSENLKEGKSHSVLETWRAGKLGYKKNQVVDELVNNFHWEIIRNRRLKGISRRQLAEAVGASEEDMKTIEFGTLPKDDFVLITKIENYFSVSLRKEKKQEAVSLSDLQKTREQKGKVESGSGTSNEETKVVDDELEIIE